MSNEQFPHEEWPRIFGKESCALQKRLFSKETNLKRDPFQKRLISKERLTSRTMAASFGQGVKCRMRMNDKTHTMESCCTYESKMCYVKFKCVTSNKNASRHI